MRTLIVLAVAAATAALSSPSPAQTRTPAAVFTDPPRDSAHPARMEVVHIPSGGVKINGVVYVASGAGLHPTVVLMHGLPGNEKNLDLAQAIRRAGWTVVTFNYRGSWGSPGVFRFGQNLEDADAVLAFLHDTSTIRLLGVDTTRIVLGGHSMGGWATALTTAHHPALRGAFLISAADLSRVAAMPRANLVAFMADDMESLAGVTGESMADDLLAGAAQRGMTQAGSRIGRTPMLVITSNDQLAPHSEAFVQAARAAGNTRVTTRHFVTDHSYSDHRIALESAVIRWLGTLR